ncbi:MAG: MarR family winged helix-turn-helix transcriptional regulator [Pseudomonadota bacterium]
MPATSITKDAPHRELTQFLSYRVVRLHHALNAQAVSVLERVAGITLPQWRVIAMVGSGAAQSSRDIARKSIIDPALISRTVKGLEDRELLTTARENNDRRVIGLALTPKGRDIYARTLPHMQARQDSLIDALDPSEQDAIFRIFDKLEMAADRREFGG